ISDKRPKHADRVGDLDGRHFRSNASRGIAWLHFDSGKAERRGVRVDTGKRTKSGESFLPNPVGDLPQFLGKHPVIGEAGGKQLQRLQRVLKSAGRRPMNESLWLTFFVSLPF